MPPPVAGRHHHPRCFARHQACAARQFTSATPATQTAMPTSADRRKLLVEHQPGHQRGHRRRQIEQAHHARRRLTADQEIQQPDRAERQPEHQPGDRDQKLAAPAHHHGLGRERADREQRRGARILHQEAGAPFDARRRSASDRACRSSCRSARRSPTPMRSAARRLRCGPAPRDRRRRRRARDRAIAAASTRSPSSRLASVEVRIGCRLTTSAAKPAGSLWSIATNTPPR